MVGGRSSISVIGITRVRAARFLSTRRSTLSASPTGIPLVFIGPLATTGLEYV
jgi:hypothetical protein